MRVPDEGDDDKVDKGMDDYAATSRHIEAKPGVLLASETVLDAPVVNTFIIPTVSYQNLSCGGNLLNLLRTAGCEIFFHCGALHEIFSHQRDSAARRHAC